MNDQKVMRAAHGAARLRADDALGEQIQGWLEVQCSQLPEAQGGLVLVASGEELLPEALWPDAATAEPLLDLGERAGKAGEGLVMPLSSGGALSAGFGVAWPLLDQGAVIAVAALAIAGEDQSGLQSTMRKLQWGAAGLQLLLVQSLSGHAREREGALAASVDLLAAVLGEQSFDAAAIALVTALATRLGADRASLGLVEGEGVKVAHVSHAAQVGETMSLIRRIEAAMDEVVDQRLPIALPPIRREDEAPIRIAHERLVAQDRGAVITIPLFQDGVSAGALMLERPSYLPFTAAEQAMVESVAALAVAALLDKKRGDQPFVRRLVTTMRDSVRTIMAPDRRERRVVIGLGVAAVLALLLARGTDRVSANAEIMPRQQIVLAAPFDGYVRSASARAGDRVRQGAAIAVLDDGDLLLERARWESRVARHGGEFQDASALQDRVQINVTSAERDEAQAQFDLANAFLARSVLKAPFDAVVVAGDLSQRIGAAVTKGEELFRVAPRGAYRVDLRIPESRIADLRSGQRGLLHLSALPSQSYGFTVAKITPRTVSEGGESYFVVEAALDVGQSPAALQPGMKGVGKVEVGTGWLPGIWTRDLGAWLRLHLWSLFG